MIKFGIYGSGWRTEFFLRVAKFCPEKFAVLGIITRNQERTKYFLNEFGATSYNNLDDFLEECNPLFMVESVNKEFSEEITMLLIEKGIPVLMETPAGKNIESMIKLFHEVEKGAKIQIAEQYPFHPLHSARINLVQQSKIGNVEYAQVSFSHGYHGISLIRKFLGIDFEKAQIMATDFNISGLSGVSRSGPPQKELLETNLATNAILKFENGRTAIYNFEMNQHRSWIRTPLVHIKGTTGEIFNESISYLKDFKTPITTDLKRINLGENQNVEGFGLKGITTNQEWVYKNPYLNSRLSDDEIAVATCLEKMQYYLCTNEDFYSFAQGAQDMYLAMMIDKSVKEKRIIETQDMPWARR